MLLLRRNPHHAIAVPTTRRVATPAGTPWPIYWPGWKSVQPKAAVVAAVKSELIS